MTLHFNHCTWRMRRPARPQPQQQGLQLAAQQHRSHRAQHRLQHRLQPPERRLDQQSTSIWTWFQSHSDRRGGRQGSPRGVLWITSTGMVWTMETARFAWQRRLSYAWYAQPSTDRRSVWFFEKNVRQSVWGAKFGMKIWTRIHRSCLGHLQTKTMSIMNEENDLCQILTKENKQSVLWSEGYPASAVSAASNDWMLR